MEGPNGKKSFTSSQSIARTGTTERQGARQQGCGSQIPCKLQRGVEERKEDLTAVGSISSYFSKSVNEEKYSR